MPRKAGFGDVGSRGLGIQGIGIKGFRGLGIDQGSGF